MVEMMEGCLLGHCGWWLFSVSVSVSGFGCKLYTTVNPPLPLVRLAGLRLAVYYIYASLYC